MIWYGAELIIGSGTCVPDGGVIATTVKHHMSAICRESQSPNTVNAAARPDRKYAIITAYSTLSSSHSEPRCCNSK